MGSEDVDRLIQRNREIFKRLDDKHGRFPDGLTYTEIVEALEDRFQINFSASGVQSWKGGQALELDVFAYSDAGEAFVVEVRSQLREDGIQDLLQTLRDFRTFFPEHQDKKLYGILAAVDASPEIQQRVLRQGIYLANIHDGVFEIRVPENFQPQAF